MARIDAPDPADADPDADPAEETVMVDREAEAETMLVDRQIEAETIVVDRAESTVIVERGSAPDGTVAVTRERAKPGSGALPATG